MAITVYKTDAGRRAARLASYKKYASTHHDEILEANRKWRARNRVSIRMKNKVWRDRNRECLLAKAREYIHSPTGRYRALKSGAGVRGHIFSLSFVEFMLFWQKPCHYCGEPIRSVGLDRIDNSIGYVLGNVVSCCKGCNYGKHRGPQEDYIARCIRVAKKFGWRS
jgi:hypothetical protein